MIVSLRHFLGWLVSVFRSREDLVLENLALRRQLRATTSPSINCPAQAVLGCVANVLVRVDQAAHLEPNSLLKPGQAQSTFSASILADRRISMRSQTEELAPNRKKSS